MIKIAYTYHDWIAILQEYARKLCKYGCMHLLYIAMKIFLKRIQQIKNVTEKENIPSYFRVPFYMCCLETLSYSMQSLSYWNSLSIRAPWGNVPQGGKSKAEAAAAALGQNLQGSLVYSPPPAIPLPCLHWPSDTEQPKHCPSGVRGPDCSQGTVSDWALSLSHQQWPADRPRERAGKGCHSLPEVVPGWKSILPQGWGQRKSTKQGPAEQALPQGEGSAWDLTGRQPLSTLRDPGKMEVMLPQAGATQLLGCWTLWG